jgi:hypothetical protein
MKPYGKSLEPLDEQGFNAELFMEEGFRPAQLKRGLDAR